MDQHTMILSAWIATGTAGLIFGMAAVAVAKRRLPGGAPSGAGHADEVLTAA